MDNFNSSQCISQFLAQAWTPDSPKMLLFYFSAITDVLGLQKNPKKNQASGSLVQWFVRSTAVSSMLLLCRALMPPHTKPPLWSRVWVSLRHIRPSRGSFSLQIDISQWKIPFNFWDDPKVFFVFRSTVWGMSEICECFYFNHKFQRFFFFF